MYLRTEISYTFMKEGYSVASIASFTAPEREILAYNPDLVVLDVNLPGKSGFELCKWLKTRASFPILILTARDTLADELYALDIGADDYLTKPCEPGRLIARTKRLLQTYSKVKNIIQAGLVILDLDTYKVRKPSGVEYVVLSPTEGQIMQCLVEAYPSIVSREQLLVDVWENAAYVDENILQVNMTRLRKQLASIGLRDVVQTVRGHGYRLGGESE